MKIYKAVCGRISLIIALQIIYGGTCYENSEDIDFRVDRMLYAFSEWEAICFLDLFCSFVSRIKRSVGTLGQDICCYRQ